MAKLSFGAQRSRIMFGGSYGGGAPVPPALTFPQSASIVFELDPSTLALANNDPVASFADSVNGLTFTQATAGSRPLFIADSGYGSLPAISFDGAGDCLVATATGSALKTAISSQTHTTILVVDIRAAHALGFIFSDGLGGDNYMFVGTGTELGRYNNGVLNCAPSDGRGFFVLAHTSTTEVYGAGTGLERWYLNGTCVASAFTPCPDSAASTDYILGAINTGGSLPAEFYLLHSYVLDVELTPAEIVQATAFIFDAFSQTAPWDAATYVALFDGNSLTSGVGAGGVVGSYPYIAAQSLGLDYGQWSNLGIGGETIAQMTSHIADWSDIQTLTAKPVKVAAFEYYNSRGLGAAQLITNTNAYAAAVRALANTKLCLGTSLSSADDPDTVRTEFNDYYDANYADHCDAYIPFHLNATVGLNGEDGVNSYSVNSATHWSDTVHHNATGYGADAGIVAPIVAAA